MHRARRKNKVKVKILAIYSNFFYNTYRASILKEFIYLLDVRLSQIY